MVLMLAARSAMEPSKAVMQIPDEKNDMKSRMPVLVMLSLATACATPVQTELDAEVRRLCAIDGGIRVYETVELPRSEFNKYGQVVFYRPTLGEDALGPDYVLNQKKTYYRRGNPEMSRIHVEIIRRSDHKLLGELVRYGRGGGDLPGPWHGSNFGCPDTPEGPLNTLLKSVFKKSG